MLHFERGDGLRCAVNLPSTAWPVPEGARPVLASARMERGAVPVDAAAWLETDGRP